MTDEKFAPVAPPRPAIPVKPGAAPQPDVSPSQQAALTLPEPDKHLAHHRRQRAKPTHDKHVGNGEDVDLHTFATLVRMLTLMAPSMRKVFIKALQEMEW